jgi:glycosyltransferase involved in cell wall biosynthesis
MGAGRVVADMAMEQASKCKHDVLVCVSTDTDESWCTDPSLVEELVSQQIEVHTIGDIFRRKAGTLHRSSMNLRAILSKKCRPVVVHAHTAMSAAVGYWARPDALIATCHGWGMDRPAEFDLQDSIAYQLCDRVLTYSHYWADRLRTDLAVFNPMVIPMGIGFDRFKPEVKHQKSSRPFRIGTVSELIPRKGIDLLLRSMPLVWDQMADVELHIIGTGQSEKSYKELASKIDPDMKRIVFHGELKNPQKEFTHWDLFALASRSDNLPVVLLEVMFCGLPVVATGVGGIPQLILAADCGLVVPAESVAALGKGILQLASQPRRRLLEMGHNGRKYVRRENSLERTVQEIENIYAESLRHRFNHRTVPVGGASSSDLSGRSQIMAAEMHCSNDSRLFGQ